MHRYTFSRLSARRPVRTTSYEWQIPFPIHITTRLVTIDNRLANILQDVWPRLFPKLLKPTTVAHIMPLTVIWMGNIPFQVNPLANSAPFKQVFSAETMAVRRQKKAPDQN